MRRPRQLELSLSAPPTWGGHRTGAGRKPTPGRRGVVPHRRRAPHDARWPAHATLRVRTGTPSLRGARIFIAVRGALGAASDVRFRVLHFSVQFDHLHLGGGGERADAAQSWSPGARDPGREGNQSCPWSARQCVGRPLPCAAALYAVRGEERADLCPQQLAEARARCERSRRSLVCGVVHRVARRHGANAGHVTRRGAADLACADRLATARSDRTRRGTATAVEVRSKPLGERSNRPAA